MLYVVNLTRTLVSEVLTATIALNSAGPAIASFSHQKHTQLIKPTEEIASTITRSILL